MIIYHYKKIGQTMNQVIDDIKKLYHTKKITYAGRLDPLAYGLVIILTDDDIYKRDHYIGQNKVYQFQMINGIQTDTYDILGLIKNINSNDFNMNKINVGKQLMEYPPYSSVPIKEHNKPYWFCALNNLLVVNKPTKEIEIFDIKLIDKQSKTKNEIIELITDRINKITVNTFRQKEILEKWNTIEDKIYDIYKLEIKISSGGYVRYVADKMNSCAIDIERLSYYDIK